MTLAKSLLAVLTTHEITEGNGVVEVNVADGLFAIAAALGHLADVMETRPPANVSLTIRPEGLTLDDDDSRPGHA